jgi:hypothetical protein
MRNRKLKSIRDLTDEDRREVYEYAMKRSREILSGRDEDRHDELDRITAHRMDREERLRQLGFEDVTAEQREYNLWLSLWLSSLS